MAGREWLQNALCSSEPLNRGRGWFKPNSDPVRMNALSWSVYMFLSSLGFCSQRVRLSQLGVLSTGAGREEVLLNTHERR